MKLKTRGGNRGRLGDRQSHAWRLRQGQQTPYVVCWLVAFAWRTAVAEVVKEVVRK